MYNSPLTADATISHYRIVSKLGAGGMGEVYLAQYTVYIKPFPNGKGKWRVSTGGGGLPHWSRRGNELFFVSGNDLMVVPVQTKPTFVLGTPQKLFSREGIWADRPEGVLDSYDVTPDGQHFVMLDGAETANERRVLNVVQNWFAEFRPK